MHDIRFIRKVSWDRGTVRLVIDRSWEKLEKLQTDKSCSFIYYLALLKLRNDLRCA